MALKLDQVIVVDVEATCWENEPPPGQAHEIIEVGICPLDISSATPLEKQSILVKPQRSRVSPFCTRLTTLTQEQVDQGVSLQDACTILKKNFLSKQRVWASYGDYDRRQFERQCQAFGVGYPFGSRHINVKSLFAIVHRLPREVGMSRALEMLNLPIEGVHHRAIDDAWNIARILSHLVLRSRGDF